LWWVDFDSSEGTEVGKRKPALIVGRDALVRATLEHARGTVTVVPVTSSVTKVYPFQVLLKAGTGGLPHASKAQAEQIRTVSVARLAERIGKVPERVSHEVDAAIRMYLGL
jgi:mRNA interferase MazF